jgi:hypothetical protein
MWVYFNYEGIPCMHYPSDYTKALEEGYTLVLLKNVEGYKELSTKYIKERRDRWIVAEGKNCRKFEKVNKTFLEEYYPGKNPCTILLPEKICKTFQFL